MTTLLARPKVPLHVGKFSRTAGDDAKKICPAASCGTSKVSRSANDPADTAAARPEALPARLWLFDGLVRIRRWRSVRWLRSTLC